jgi:GntR family transcriptional regulator
VLSRYAAIPLYRQVADELEGRIRGGRYRTGDRLPAETGLAEEFAVNRLTVRRAIGELVAQGLLEVRQGAGTFVAEPAMRIEMPLDSHRWPMSPDRLPHFEAGREARMAEDLADYTDREAPEARAHLRFDGGLVCPRTVLRAGAEPWGVSTYHLPESRVPDLRRHLRQDGPSIYEVLSETYGLALLYSWRSMGAAAASGEEAAMLGIAPGSPMVLREGVTVDGEGAPVFYVRRVIRADKVKFVLRYE